MSEIRELLEDAISRFNARVDEDEKLAKELEGVERSIAVKISDEGKYHFNLKDKHATPLEEGDVDADIEILTDKETFLALFKKEMGPMKAIATKKLKINASLQDMIRIRKFF